MSAVGRMAEGTRADMRRAFTGRACMHDPAVFEDPDEFRPERFIRDGKLDVSARDPSAFAFGFGRRCVEPRLGSH